jgi:triacylglycerol esterase/lipase EstA (alpha/beta hydrolase family)
MPSPHRRNWLRRTALAAVATSAVALALTSVLVAPARAATRLPVNWDFTAGAALTALTPDTPPPGANNPSCALTAAHPDPVILVNGTFANMDDNWQAASPLLANNGYCVYAFNYGGTSPTSPIQGLGDIATSAGQLATFVNTVLAETGASKVDLVGHSQGGMMPRYYLNFLGGASKVNDFVALAPSNYGTTLDGLTELASLLGVTNEINGPLSSACESCVQQEQGSSFLANLNASPTVAGVHYTVIESVDDEVVTPYSNAFLPAASNVTNILVQNQCILRPRLRA